MPKMNAFYAQSGGVTAVINASACGVIETARKHRDRIGKVYAGRNGIIGALREDLIDTSKESARDIAALKFAPGGAFGSCRYKLKGLEENRAQYERLIEVFNTGDPIPEDRRKALFGKFELVGRIEHHHKGSDVRP